MASEPSSSAEMPAISGTAEPTASMPTRRDPALDGLRGVAVLLVFLFHYSGGLQSSEPLVRLLGFVTEGGWVGIVLFFALSGFLITSSLWDSVGQPHYLRNFYIRRGLRILPLYFLALLAAAVCAVARGVTFSELKPLGLFVFFLQDLPVLAGRALQSGSPLPLYHLWTLAVEEQFYLLWPLVLLVAHSRPHALRLSLWYFSLTELFLVTVYAMPAFAPARAHHTFDDFLFTHSGALALGAAVALAMGNRVVPAGRRPGTSRLIRKFALPAFLTGIGLFLYTSYNSGSAHLTAPLQFWLGLPAISIAAAACIPLVLRNGLPRTVLSLPVLGWVGRISYGFYIFHILLEPIFDNLAFRILHEDSGNDYQLTRLLLALPITLLVSWISLEMFELPILSLKRRFPMRHALPWGQPIEETFGRESHRHRRRSHSRG